MATERAQRLASASLEELVAILDAELAVMSVEEARAALRNPFVTGELIARVLRRDELAAFYELQRDVVLHPRTAQTLSLQLVGGLLWRDLVRVGLEPRVPPVVRRAADVRLLERLPSLAVGERISIARSAGVAVLGQLRNDPTPRVVEALLENPRLTEGILLPLVSSAEAAPPVLALVAANARWGCRYEIRRALARNPRTPVATAIGLLPLLRKQDLRAIPGDPRLQAPVRERARLLLGTP